MRRQSTYEDDAHLVDVIRGAFSACIDGWCHDTTAHIEAEVALFDRRSVRCTGVRDIGVRNDTFDGGTSRHATSVSSTFGLKLMAACAFTALLSAFAST